MALPADFPVARQNPDRPAGERRTNGDIEEAGDGTGRDAEGISNSPFKSSLQRREKSLFLPFQERLGEIKILKSFRRGNMKMDIKTTKKLNNGVEIPYLGFGVFQVKGRRGHGEGRKMGARTPGYRHLDTATAYRNEGSVGRPSKRAASTAKTYLSRPSWRGGHETRDADAGI